MISFLFHLSCSMPVPLSLIAFYLVDIHLLSPCCELGAGDKALNKSESLPHKVYSQRGGDTIEQETV